MNRACMDQGSSAEDSCIATQRSADNGRNQNSDMYEVPLQKKKDRLPFQIFPDPVEVVLSPEETLRCMPQEKERLPSIVVEPTDISEVESGELRWPPECEDSEDEDLFLEQCIPPANVADWGEEDENESICSSNLPSTSLLELQSNDFRDDTPTLLPENVPALN